MINILIFNIYSLVKHINYEFPLLTNKLFANSPSLPICFLSLWICLFQNVLSSLQLQNTYCKNRSYSRIYLADPLRTDILIVSNILLQRLSDVEHLLCARPHAINKFPLSIPVYNHPHNVARYPQLTLLF